MQIWKIILFHLPNEGLERLKCFVVVFYAHINTAFRFVFFWVEIQNQMEVLDPIYMAPNKWKKDKKFEYSFCIVWWNVTVLIKCFHLQNKTVNGVQNMSQKIINQGVL